MTIEILKHRLRRMRYIAITISVCFILILSSLFWYIGYVDSKRESAERQNDRQWCELVVFYDSYYQENPPDPAKATTAEQRKQLELNKRQAQLMHNRRIALGC